MNKDNTGININRLTKIILFTVAIELLLFILLFVTTNYQTLMIYIRTSDFLKNVAGFLIDLLFY
jgi:hypothetical protein